jgi:putative flippase GtrA
MVPAIDNLFRNYLVQNKAQLIKFLIVGVLTCGIYFLTFHIFYANIDLDYRIAASIAYVITVCTHFLLNRSFTFDASQQKMMMNVWKYILMLFINYTTLMAIMCIVVNSIFNSPYVGVAISTVLSAFINFVMMKYFVFEPRAITEG